MDKFFQTIRKTLQYTSIFRGATFIIKVSGSIIEKSVFKSLIQDIAILYANGIRIVIVHGGGGQIDKELKKKNIPIEKVNGLRVTSKRALAVVASVSDRINKTIVDELKNDGASAVGNLQECIRGTRFSPTNFTGMLHHVEKRQLNENLKNAIVVLSPLGLDRNCNLININADHIALDIAKHLKAEKLIFMSNVDGVYDKKGNVIPFITSKTARQLINSGVISGGMIPKMESCIYAIKHNVNSVVIINGMEEGTLLKEIATEEGVGTMITDK